VVNIANWIAPGPSALGLMLLAGAARAPPATLIRARISGRSVSSPPSRNAVA